MASVTSLSSLGKPSVIPPCTKANIQILQQDWGGRGGGGKTSDSGYILKVEPIRFADGLDMGWSQV